MTIRLAKESWKAFALLPDNTKELQAALGGKVSAGEPMALHTSFRIGGPADLFAVARSSSELCEYIKLACEHNVPYFVLGRGTNILVSDRGIRGLVIWNQSGDFKTRFITAPPSGARSGSGNGLECVLEAESGVLLSNLVNHTARLGLAGLEWAAGIPGTLGGAIVNNAGAFDGAMSDIVQGVSVLEAGQISTWDPSKLGFDYRTSSLKHRLGYGGVGTKEQPVILQAMLLLRREAIAKLQTRISEYLARRRETQPKEPSAGSVFKNPPGEYAGQLIEQAGLKGLRKGSAQVSVQHANFIINLGQATGGEVYALIEAVRERVYHQFHVALDLEIQLVGDWPESARGAP